MDSIYRHCVLAEMNSSSLINYICNEDSTMILLHCNDVLLGHLLTVVKAKAMYNSSRYRNSHYMLAS